MNPPTYPARPMNGGSLERARPKPDPEAWVYEPKINGWRMLIDVRNKKMWTRYNQPSSVEAKYASVLDRLASVFGGDAPTWLDAEALGQRASCIGRGSLVVFDVVWPLTNGEWNTWRERRRFLDMALDVSELWEINALPKQDTIYRLPHVAPCGATAMLTDDEVTAPVMEFYDELKAANARLGVELYEGVVAKRIDKQYPIQLRSPAQETTDWVKHRWH